MSTKQVKKRKKKEEKEFYVDPKEFEEELREFYKTDVISERLGKMIYDMVHGLAHAGNFINYTFKEEAIGDSLQNIMKALRAKKFDFSKRKEDGTPYNPFSYFNCISYNCWRNRIKKEERMREALAAYREEVYESEMQEGMQNTPENFDRDY